MALSLLTACGSNSKTLSSNTQQNEEANDVNDTGGDTGWPWPDNEFTRQVPKPDDAVLSVTELESGNPGLIIVFSKPENNDGIRTYIEQLKSVAGFTIDMDEMGAEKDTGNGVIKFEAKNEDGYLVKLLRNGHDEVWSLTIEKTSN